MIEAHDDAVFREPVDRGPLREALALFAEADVRRSFWACRFWRLRAYSGGILFWFSGCQFNRLVQDRVNHTRDFRSALAAFLACRVDLWFMLRREWRGDQLAGQGDPAVIKLPEFQCVENGQQSGLGLQAGGEFGVGRHQFFSGCDGAGHAGVSPSLLLAFSASHPQRAGLAGGGR